AEAETCTDATIAGSINYGDVRGDINVGGIAGTMAIDYDYDMEGDVTGIKDSKLNTSYITKCVLRDDRNYAGVESVKDYAGGVCGLQEMGTLLRGENYAPVSSDSGDDVGGIAGSSLSYIVSSFSRGSISGNNYLGGIVGDGTHIRDSVSIVAIDASGSRCGAIAGHIKEDGEVRNNYFVSDDLAGIDRVSYSLKAEPVSYAELMNVQKRVITEDMPQTFEIPVVPSDFDHLTVTYMLDDEDSDEPVQISKARVDYGDRITQEEYPSVDPKEGFYVEWDKPSIEYVSTDMTVTAKYKRYLTTLSDPTGSNPAHQSEILVDGAFKEGDSLVVARKINYDSDDPDTLAAYETIELIIPDDGMSVHQIRFKPDTVYGDEVGDDFILRVVEADGLEELPRTGSLGGYYTYDLSGNEAKLILDVSSMEKNDIMKTVLIAVAGTAAAALIAVIIWAVTRRKNRKKIRRAVRHMKRDIRTRIDNKEQMFVPDDMQADEPETDVVSSDKDGDGS
ncbi:MAG: hypothetical protein IKS16_04210, partial [Lachnospiraceae bacterium]|nr:hypothetical protein [Lachnospiraceae bacterium]